ncbi:MAG: 2Fe-2S iron-sulfur cluster-binding protein [Treponema sp.]|nr:2Fe-2S iron-sulfur cluster-binding protein [Treponema sp.]
MKIPLTLNNKKTVFTAETTDTLLSVLRRLNLYSVKCGCEKGICGNCMILLDGEPVPSCTIPAGIIRDRKIMTLEYFKTDPCYQDIVQGFNQAGIHMCGYCNAGKILTTYSILKKYYRPSLEEIHSAIKDLDCCCTDYATLTNGILYAVAAKHTREGKKQNGKK